MTEIKELFIEHYEILNKYKIAKRKFDDLQEKKARLILSMQPQGTDYSKEPISGGGIFNKFDDFVIRLEKLDPDLQKARNERDLEEYYLKKKELELENSDDILDNVYYLKYIQKMKVRNICIKLNYGKSHIYRYLEEIDKKIKMGKNGKNLEL